MVGATHDPDIEWARLARRLRSPGPSPLAVAVLVAGLLVLARLAFQWMAAAPVVRAIDASLA